MNMSKTAESTLGSLQMYILSILWSREMYGLEIIKHLRIRAYDVGTNQLYPALKRLESLAAVESRKEERVGTTRIYYRITPKGKQLMMQQLMGLIDLFQEILLDKLDFMGDYCGEILHITPGMHVLDISKDYYDAFVHAIVQQILPDGIYYIVAKGEEKQNLYQDRVEIFHFEPVVKPIIPNQKGILSIPESSIDIIVAFFTIRTPATFSSLTELKRVLKPNGKGVIIDWPMAKSDVRNNMITSILPEKRGVDSAEICDMLHRDGFSTIIHTEKEGIAVIEFVKPEF
jgi:DNA-binding PadR family transcriptional regulator